MGKQKLGQKHYSDWILILSLVALKLLAHFLTNTNYGLHRDTLLYIAQGEHPAWGYISVPPFTAMITILSRFLFGDSNFGFAFFPALAGGINIILIGLIVRELSGKKIAILLACSAYLLSPAFLRSNTLLQPVSFDELFWLLSAYFIIKLVSTRDPAYWIWIGFTAGIGFLNKYSIVFFFAAFIVALLLTRERKWLRTYFPYTSLIIAFLLAAPNLYWQYRHNWPIVEHMQELQQNQLVHVEYGSFLLMQMIMNLNVAFVWIAGLVFFLLMKNGKHFRIIGLIFLTGVVLLMVLHGKPYYTLGLYPMMFAGGGIVFESLFKSKFRFAPYALLVVMIVLVMPILPFSLPVYSHQKMVEFGKWVSKHGMSEPLKWEDGNYYALPQDYADMTGWEETAQNVAKVYHGLTLDDRANCLIYASSYGQAGAVNFYRKKYQIPEAICCSESFIFWAPKNVHAEKAIYIEEKMRDQSDFYRNIELKAQVTDPFSRDHGYVYLMSDTIGNVNQKWEALIKENKARFSKKIQRQIRKEAEKL